MKPLNIFGLCILFFVLLCVVLFVLPYFMISNFLNSKHVYMKNVFSEQETQHMCACLDMNQDDALPCYHVNQDLIFSRVKTILGVPYMKVGHARWSNGTVNYDAQSYHRDVKPYFYFPKTYPKVYTLIVFLDDAQHRQGKTILSAKRGDCLLFNAFNVHSGYNMGHVVQTHKKRRLLQFFHVFFDEQEYHSFEKDHVMVSHTQNDFFTKYINGTVDLRSGLEYMNAMPVIIPNKALDNNQHYKYTTFIEPTQFVGNVNGVDYYNKL